MAPTAAQFAALRERFNVGTSAIAARIKALLEQQARTDLTAAEEQKIFDEFTAIADELDAMGKPDVPLPGPEPEPVPEPEPEPVPEPEPEPVPPAEPELPPTTAETPSPTSGEGGEGGPAIARRS